MQTLKQKSVCLSGCCPKQQLKMVFLLMEHHALHPSGQSYFQSSVFTSVSVGWCWEALANALELRGHSDTYSRLENPLGLLYCKFLHDGHRLENKHSSQNNYYLSKINMHGNNSNRVLTLWILTSKRYWISKNHAYDMSYSSCVDGLLVVSHKFHNNSKFYSRVILQWKRLESSPDTNERWDIIIRH